MNFNDLQRLLDETQKREQVCPTCGRCPTRGREALGPRPSPWANPWRFPTDPYGQPSYPWVTYVSSTGGIVQ